MRKERRCTPEDHTRRPGGQMTGIIMKKRIVLLLCAVFCVLVIVAGARPIIFRERSSRGGDIMTVLCYGDSNTYGYDPRSFFGSRYPEDARWVDILAEKTGLNTVNAGENGREIPRRDAEYQQFRELLEQSRADCLIVMLGGNDLMQGASPETAADRMERFLSQIDGIDRSSIILVGPPPKKLGAWVPDESLIRASEELCAAYETLAERMEIRFVNAGEWDIELCYDGVHFTENGHEAFAAGMAEFLEEDMGLTAYGR